MKVMHNFLPYLKVWANLKIVFFLYFSERSGHSFFPAFLRYVRYLGWFFRWNFMKRKIQSRKCIFEYFFWNTISAPLLEASNKQTRLKIKRKILKTFKNSWKDWKASLWITRAEILRNFLIFSIEYSCNSKDMICKLGIELPIQFYYTV